MALTIAIDETGEFRGKKLLGGAASSGVGIIGTVLSTEEIFRKLGPIAERHSVPYPNGLHRTELVFAKNYVAIDELALAMESMELFRCGVYGRGISGRAYFHEQEAYGDMLLAALRLVPIMFGSHLAEAKSIEILVGTRSRIQLVGYLSDELGRRINVTAEQQMAEAYHKELVGFLTSTLPSLGWSMPFTVVARSATRNPYLAMADFACGAMSGDAGWVTPVEQIQLPSIEKEIRTFLGATDPVAFALHVFKQGGDLPAGWLDGLPDVTADTVLHGLLHSAQAMVTDRHGRGSLETAGRLAEALWPRAERRKAETVQALLCAIGFEVVSHLGEPADGPVASRWVRRREQLLPRAWGRSGPELFANRLEVNCQLVQCERFNVFEFEDALYEFLGIEQAYRKDYGEAGEDPCDVLYGKILGTVGQAMGFLKPQVPNFAEDVLPYLLRSKPCFAAGSPQDRTLNLGLRLTELWDNGELELLEELMRAERLPKAAEASVYDLLHRLRGNALSKSIGRPIDLGAVGALVKQLLELCQNKETVGATPYDLCLKWALYLDPNNSNLMQAATDWFANLDPSHVTILATSLPLALELGLTERARQALEIISGYPGFLRHWETIRATGLRSHMEKGQVGPGLDYETLRGMPWNYA